MCPLILWWWRSAPRLLPLSKWAALVDSPDLYLYALKISEPNMHRGAQTSNYSSGWHDISLVLVFFKKDRKKELLSCVSNQQSVASVFRLQWEFFFCSPGENNSQTVENMWAVYVQNSSIAAMVSLFQLPVVIINCVALEQRESPLRYSSHKVGNRHNPIFPLGRQLSLHVQLS